MNRTVAFGLIAVAALLPISCGDRSPTEPDPQQSGSFNVSVPAAALTGEPFTVTVTAVSDEGVAPDPSFDAAVSISASAGTLTIDDMTLQDGVGTATVAVFGTTGRITLSVADPADATRTGSASLDIAAAGEAGLQITSDSAFLLIATGDTARAAAMVFRDDGSADPAAVVTWTSSDPSIVQIDADGLMTAMTDVGAVTVTASSGALTSRPVDVSVVQLAADTRVISASLVTSIAADGSSATLNVAPATSALEVGDILVSTAGILARITSVSAGADAIVVNLEPARLNEAFLKLRMEGTTAAAPIEANISSRGIAVYSLSGQFVPETFPLGALQCTRENGAQATLNFSGGDIQIESNPVITFRYSLDHGLDLEDLEMYVTDRPSVGLTSASLTLSAQTEGSIKCMYDLPVSINIPVATVAGIVTVTGRLAPSIGFQLEGSAKGEVKISTPSPSAGVALKLGAAYDGVLDEWSMITESDPFFEPGTLGDFTEEVTAEFGATALIPLVEVGGGINIKMLHADAVGLDFVKPKVFGSFDIKLEHPFTPAQREYKGAVWDLSVKATADISIKLTGAVADALEYFGVDVSYEQEGFELFSIEIVKSPKVEVKAVHGANGAVDLSASTSADYAGSRVEFWAFADGEATATSIAQATLDAAGKATAEWELPDAGGGYEIAAYLYGSPFSAIDLPYPSALTPITSDSITVAVTPARVGLYSGDQQQFTATVTGTDDTAVTWSAHGNGAVDSNGLFTAGEPGSAVVIATSTADPDAYGAADVFISRHPCIPTPDNPCSGGSGASSGDPHLMTFDGEPYDFMAAGDFRLVKSTISGDAFEVQTRYRKPDVSERWSWNNAVAMNVAGDTVEVYSTQIGGIELVIDGETLAAADGLSRTLPDGGHVGMDGGRLTISWPDRTMVEIRPATWEANVLASVRVLLPDARFGAVEGLFGDFDGDRTNDIRIRNGATVDPSSDELYMEFRQSWRVPYGSPESMFSRGPDPWDALFPPEVISLDDLDPAAVAAARQICATVGIVHPSVADGCAFDVALTGDDEWALIALGIDPAVRGVTLVPGGAVMLAGESRQFGGVVSGTDNRTVVWSVTGGTIDEDSPSLMTYTAPAEPGTYTITAQLAEDPAIVSTGTVRVFSGTPGGRIWTGELSDQWSEAGNWLPEGVPGATDDVTISAAAAPRQPRLTTNVTVRNLVHESGTIDLSTHVLSVTGNADSRGSYTGSGRVEMSGATGTVQGTFATLAISGVPAVITAAGPVTVTDSLYVSTSGVFDVGAHTVEVEGVFRTLNRGVLRMQDAAGVLRVAGRAHFGGGDMTGLLTAGTIEVAGDFIQQPGRSGCCASFPTSFQSAGTHVVLLNGTGAQTLDFQSGGLTASESFFRTLRITNPDHVIVAGTPAVKDTFEVMTPALIDGAGTLRLSGVAITAAGSTVATTGIVLEGVTAASGTFSPDTIWFVGRHRTIQGGLSYRNAVVLDTVSFAGDADLSGSLLIDAHGVLDIAGHTVTVGDSINTRTRGKLRMQDPAGELRIAGTARFAGGDTNGLLTAGTLEVAGDFVQVRGRSGCCNAFPRSFQAGGTHTVVLNGAASQTVEFQDAGLAADQSRFGALRIENSGTVQIVAAAAGGAFDVLTGATVEGTGALEVAGAFSTVAGSSIDVDRVLLHGPMSVAGTFSPDSVWFEGTGQQIQGGLDYHNIIVRDTVAFASDADISGDVVVRDRGVLDIAGTTVSVTGDFHTMEVGKLRMQDAAGVLRIGGTAEFGGGETNGLLAAGTIEAAGDFIQRTGRLGCCNSYPRSFQAGGSHVVLLNGTAPQAVDFQAGGLAADESRFGTLRIANVTDVGFLGSVGAGANLDLTGHMTVPVDVTLDIGGILHLRATSILNNQGTISVPACSRETGSTINGIDPCS